MLYKGNFIKEPIGWKMRKIVGAILKKLNYRMTWQKRMDLFIKKGLTIGKNVHIDGSVKIDESFCHLISIGDNCRITRGVTILAHDGSMHQATGGYGRAGFVDIKDNCIIGVNAIILPGVTIGPNVLVASGSVVNKDIPPDSCVAGVPARHYGRFSDFISNFKEKIDNSYVFTQLQLITDYEEFKKEKERMINEAKKGDIIYKIRKPRIVLNQRDKKK